jgi:hypothetical protein
MIVTLYTRTITRRRGPDKGKAVVLHTHYATQKTSPMHAHLVKQYPGAVTYDNVSGVITDFIPGMPLDKPVLQFNKPVAEVV